MSDFVTTRDGSADALGVVIRHTLKIAMVAHGFSEERFAQELSNRSGRNINVGLVHAWTAPSKHKWRMSADLVPFVCEILGDDSIQRLLLSEKLRKSLELGEDVPRVAEMLRSALREPRRRSKR